jgi:hypothetical protein
MFFTIFECIPAVRFRRYVYGLCKLTIKPKPSYLHFIVTGRNSKQTVIRYLAEILRECKIHNCSRILIEECLEGPRLGTVDIFSIVSEVGGAGLGILKTIAYVDVNAEGSLMQFAETVAFNRSLPVHIFLRCRTDIGCKGGKQRFDCIVCIPATFYNACRDS